MKKIVILFIILLFIFAGIFIWWTNGLKAPNPKNRENKIFVINKGAVIRQIGNNLKKEGLIKDPVVFFVYVKKEGIDKNIQAGSYRLSPSMSLPEVMDTLQHGTIDVWVTVPEGFRAEEIAEVLSKSITTYDPSWISVLKKNEGYLFPDTYLIPHSADIDTVVKIMRNNFDTKLSQSGIEPSQLNRTIIIASLIEREALFHDDFPYVSSVIQNRLSIGMGLQIDATVQYALGYSEEEKTWWRNPTASDLKINSPYNTYIHAGLPPGPIGNPGIDAIKAAENPANSDYLYYVNDANGKLQFAETLEEHNRNVEKFLR